MSDFPILDDFSNAVHNPSLNGFRQQAVVYEKDGRQRIIEAPDHWTWVYTPKTDDPGAVPSVYHRSPGMSISGGYIPWHGGFEQEVQFVQGQRYLGRGAIVPTFQFTSGGNFSQDIQFRFVITDDSGNNHTSDWLSSNDPNWQGKQHEMLWVFEPQRSFMGKFRFECWVKWGNTNGDMQFSAIQMQRAPSDYRDDIVAKIGSAGDVKAAASTATKPSKPTTSTQPQTETPMLLEIDILDYIRGDGRVYDVEFQFPGNTYSSGVERMQTQIEGRRFFHVKGGPGANEHNWEELWYDNQFIWRGTDISPNEEEYYITQTEGQYGQKWIPRIIRIGDKHLAVPLVTFRYKSNGQNVSGKDPYHFGHWIELKKIHHSYKFESGITLDDVVELWGYLDDGGKPGLNFERYFYAAGFGLVGWMDPTKNWRSYIKQTGVSGVTHLARKRVPTIQLPELPPLEGVEPQAAPTPVLPVASDEGWKLHKVHPVYQFINLRTLPTVHSDKKAKIEEQESLHYIHTRGSSEQPDGVWYPIMSQDKKTFVAWVREDVINFEAFSPAVEPAGSSQPSAAPTKPGAAAPQTTASAPATTSDGRHIKVTLKITAADGVDPDVLKSQIASITVDSFEIVDG